MALTLCVSWWLLRNGHKFDVIVGWITNGIIAAVLKRILRWRNTRVCLILYRLPDEAAGGFANQLKRLVLRIASGGADTLLALDGSQAASFARILGRSAGTTGLLTYGVDTDWYDIRLRENPPATVPATIFCPGSAYRDETTFENAIRDLEVEAKRYQLDNSGKARIAEHRLGKALLKKNYNAPYASYLADCRSAAMVVIAVENADKPVGLTSLLECMALGRPVIITRGASSRDYVRDGINGLLYEEGKSEDLREKIRYLLRHPDVAERIGTVARDMARHEFGLVPCGTRFFKYLHK
jgi:glycosyltransferase involved in cell wall biosynthesis